MKTKKKPLPEASPPVPAKPQPAYVQAAVARFQAKAAATPPGISITKNESGGLQIDTDSPDLKDGMIALMDALGTHDVAFFTGYLSQIVSATTKGQTPDPSASNAALAFIRGIQPRDEVEAALAAQMAATHNAVMTFARRLNHVDTIPQQDSASNAFNKLTRSYCAQMEALKKYRSTGEQKVTVTHVSVSDGGQAIVGNVTTGGGGSKKGNTTP